MFVLDQSVKDLIEEKVRESHYANGYLQLEKLVKDLNLSLKEADFKDDNISGGIKKQGDLWTIYINKHDTFNRKRFTTAHEIGHYISYISGSLSKVPLDEQNELMDYAILERNESNKYKEVEKEANEIAGRILMPEFEVRYLVKNNYDVDEIADHFLVSTSAVTVRLRNLGYEVLEQW